MTRRLEAAIRPFHPLLRALIAVAIVAPALPAQGRDLSWPSMTVTAHLDSTGTLRVAEQQVMRFTGDWNGGQRRYRVRFSQEFTLRRIARLDPATGAFRDLTFDAGIDDVDEWSWGDNSIVRWRSRRPQDPPFDGREITYLLEVEYRNILTPTGDGAYTLSHDFAFSDREGRISRFDLTLTLDPVWAAAPGFTGRFSATDLYPGSGFDVSLPLTFTGAGLPSAVMHGAAPALRGQLNIAIATALVLMLAMLLRREAKLGRFAPLPAPNEITKEWLDANVFSKPAEVVGAAWDDRTSSPEVAATLARLIQEKKLSSSVQAKGKWIFRNDVLSLELEVPRSELRGHERTLVDALFGANDRRTDTERVRERYKSTGFDPAALISPRLKELVELTTPGAPGAKPSRQLTLILALTALALIGLGLSQRAADLPGVLIVLGISIPIFGIATIFAAVWRHRVSGLVGGAIFFLVPLAFGLGAFSTRILSQDVFRTAALPIVGLTLWVIALMNSVMNSARSRQSPERIVIRKRLAAARRLFKQELTKPQPALRDEWFPYVVAFGLGAYADRWFRAFGPAGSEAAGVISSGRSSDGSSSWSSGTSWSGFGGGGGFAGGGSSASFAAAIGGMAASVSAPSSDSSGGGGGGGGGSSSGGGGGGGW